MALGNARPDNLTEAESLAYDVLESLARLPSDFRWPSPRAAAAFSRLYHHAARIARIPPDKDGT